MTAVPAESQAIRRAWRSEDLVSQDVTLAAVGVGPVAASASTARLLALAEAAGQPYQIVLCAGIAGGFSERTAIGDVVVATSTIAADLGSADGDRFLSLEELGFGSTTLTVAADVVSGLCRALPAAVAGPVLTVSTATGSASREAWLRDRHPDAVAEAMEGFGVASAAAGAGVAFGEIRAVSNPIGDRDLTTWRLSDALASLGSAFATLLGSPRRPRAGVEA